MSNLNRSAITDAYETYQSRYISEPRESDKAILTFLEGMIAGRSGLRILDIGCSTGNLMAHINAKFPGHQLCGGDLSESSLAIAREAFPKFSFRQMDVLNLDTDTFDIIIVNAVTYAFRDEEYERAIVGVSRSLKPGGSYVAFEWVNEHDGQHIDIIERTVAHPLGVELHARPRDFIRRAAEAGGLTDVQFTPFFIPIELPLVSQKDGIQRTRTLRLQDGRNLSMRGGIFQPWCFVRAIKP